jgi:hypothetical protein
MTIKTNVAFDPVAIAGSYTVLRGVTSPVTRSVVTKLWLYNTTLAAIDIAIYLNDTPDLSTPTLIDNISVGPLAGRSIQSAVGYSVPEGWYLLATQSGTGVNALYSMTDYDGNS